MITKENILRIRYFRKRKDTKKYVEINTWKELEGMLQCDLDLKLFNHSGIIICLLVIMIISRENYE